MTAERHPAWLPEAQQAPQTRTEPTAAHPPAIAPAGFSLQVGWLQFRLCLLGLTCITPSPPTQTDPLHALQGYDLTEEPDFWPAVEQTPEGLRIVTAAAAPTS